VSPDELKMSNEPKAPGAIAVILFRQLDRDDSIRIAHEDNYFRVKILTEEGRKYADIEIPFFPGQTGVDNIHARTIEPGGSIVNFGEQVFQKQIVKARGVKYMAKTFTLPNVQVGSILEYYYTINMNDRFVGFDSHWIISNELFTKFATFLLKPYNSDRPPLYFRCTWSNLPPGKSPPTEAPNHLISLDVHEERHADDAARKKYLEDEVKEWIPTACDVDLTNQPDWKSSDDLVAEFNVKVPA
jgi:Domain of Unknown Function with PDB structure (DUF3857)